MLEGKYNLKYESLENGNAMLLILPTGRILIKVNYAGEANIYHEKGTLSKIKFFREENLLKEQ